MFQAISNYYIEAQAGRLAAQLQEASAQMQQRLTAAEALGREDRHAMAYCTTIQVTVPLGFRLAVFSTSQLFNMLRSVSK